MRSTRPFHPFACAVAALVLLSGGCRPAPPAALDPGNARPVQAVDTLVAALRDDDPRRFARSALPPELRARVEAGWRDGRSRWPLEELPLGRQWPRMLATLSAADAESTLGAAFDRQFAGADAEIRSAVATLGLFGMQVVRHDSDYDEAERDHLAQWVVALGRWADAAPLADRERGHAAIARLVAAARETPLASDAEFGALGMDAALAAFGGFTRTLRAVLADYGLDLGATLAGLEARLESQTGDRARVRLRYEIAGTPIDGFVDLERRDGHWYVRHLLHHAEATLAAAPPAPSPLVGPTAAGIMPNDAHPTDPVRRR